MKKSSMEIIRRLMDELQGNDRKLAEADEACTALLQRNTEVNTANRNWQDKCEKLERDKAEKENRYEARIVAFEHDVQVYQSRIENQKKTLEELQNKLEIKQATIEAAKETIAEYKKQVEILSAKDG